MAEDRMLEIPMTPDPVTQGPSILRGAYEPWFAYQAFMRFARAHARQHMGVSPDAIHRRSTGRLRKLLATEPEWRLGQHQRKAKRRRRERALARRQLMESTE